MIFYLLIKYNWFFTITLQEFYRTDLCPQDFWFHFPRPSLPFSIRLIAPFSSPSFLPSPFLFPGVCLMDWCYYLNLLHPSVFKAGRWLYLSSFSVLKRRLGHCSAPLPVWEKLRGKNLYVWQTRKLIEEITIFLPSLFLQSTQAINACLKWIGLWDECGQLGKFNKCQQKASNLDSKDQWETDGLCLTF